MPVPLAATTACVFDAYGTLFDFLSASTRCRDALGDKAEALGQLWRTRQLEYSWLRSLMGTHADFWQVTGEALDFTMANLGIRDAALRDRLMDLFLHIEAFPDARRALEALKRAKRPALILSNGSPSMLAAAAKSAGIEDLLEAALSVESAGIYKPHRRVYELVVLHLKLSPERICFVSSNGWDAAGAALFGFGAVWANRSGAPRENLPGTLAAEIRDLDALPALLGLLIGLMPAYREGSVSAQDGLALYYRDYGDRLAAKTPVLCLSGLTRNSADFATLAERLSSERRVICPDYRGRGRSAYDRDWRHYDPYVYISDISHLLTATGIGRAVIVGTSMGGLLTMGLAVLRPTLVAGAVLNDIGPDVASPGLGRILQYVGVDHPQSDWGAAIRFLKDLTPNLKPKADDTWWRTHADATYRKGADGRLHFDWDLALAKPLEHQRKTTPDLWTMFRGLQPIPTLAFRGALSDVLSEDVFRRMALEKPDLVCVTVPETGHTPSLTEPEATSALDAFLLPL